MKRLAFTSTLTAVLAIFVFGGVAVAANQPYRSGTNTVVSPTEVVDHSLFVTGSTVTIAGTVNGDVFCAGKTVFVTGTVNGDVMCAGQEVRIGGTVNGSVRAAGQSVSIAGTVQRAISLAGQSVSVEPDAKIGGDATLAGSSVLVAGNLARDAYAAGATVTVTGNVARNFDARTDDLTVSAGSVDGTVNQVKSPDNKAKESAKESAPKAGLGFLFFINLMMFITAMLLVIVAPRRFNGLAELVLTKPSKTLAIGLITTFLLPFVLVLLLVTIVGIPLALLLGIVWAGAGILSGPVVAYVVGRKLLQDSHQPLVIMAVGSLVVLLVYLVPVLNIFAGMAVYIMGMGALTQAVGRALGKPVYNI